MERKILVIDQTEVVSHSKNVEISEKKYLKNLSISAVIYI
jgi:hypothetical protein